MLDCRNMGALEWGDLRYFLAVARGKSLAAARDLGVEPSTVGRRVASLETSVGSELFLRTREGLRLAAAGERILEAAQRVEAEVQGLSTAARAGDEQISGLVRLATTDALGVFLVERGLLGLQARHPGLEIELIVGNQPSDLLGGEVDLALRVSKPEGAALLVRPVSRLEFAVCAGSGYLRTRGRPRSAAELRGHDVILPSGELCRLPEARWLEALEETRVVFRSNSMRALVAAAARGAGVTVITGPGPPSSPGSSSSFRSRSCPPAPSGWWLAATRARGPRCASWPSRSPRVWGPDPPRITRGSGPRQLRRLSSSAGVIE
jgi:DNA-binding transcriptional LysR family regulator